MRDWLPYSYETDDLPQPKETAPVTTPLSEDEMRAFFERMVTTIVGYSKQDQEIKELQNKFSEVTERLNRMSDYVVRLEATNQNLTHQVEDQRRLLNEQTIQTKDALQDFDAERSVTVRLREENDLVHAQLSETAKQLADSHRLHDEDALSIADRDSEIDRLKDQLSLVLKDRDEASKLYSDTRDELSEAKRKLAGVEAAIRNVNEAFSAAQNVVNF